MKSKQIKIELIKTPSSHDSDIIVWRLGTKKVGAGYKGKKDGKNHVTLCPMCGKENYAFAIGIGNCCWCQYNPNE